MVKKKERKIIRVITIWNSKRYKSHNEISKILFVINILLFYHKDKRLIFVFSYDNNNNNNNNRSKNHNTKFKFKQI